MRGAKGTRTPGLLDANHIFCVFLRRLASPDEALTCGDRRRVSVGIARSRTPLALCLALLRHPSGFGGGARGASGSTCTASPQVVVMGFPASHDQETAGGGTNCRHLALARFSGEASWQVPPDTAETRCSHQAHVALPSRAVLRQGGTATRRRWPGVSAGLSLRGPPGARRATRPHRNPLISHAHPALKVQVGRIPGRHHLQSYYSPCARVGGGTCQRMDARGSETTISRTPPIRKIMPPPSRPVAISPTEQSTSTPPATAATIRPPVHPPAPCGDACRRSADSGRSWGADPGGGRVRVSVHRH